jgi:hypothetical protein
MEHATKPTTTEDGRPIRYTDRSFKWDTGRKTSAGSFLTIQKDGSVTYRNPNCLKYTPPGSKPFKLPALNPRMEVPAKTFERLTDSIHKRAEKDHVKNFARFGGRPCFDNWTIVTTDGHTALLDHSPNQLRKHERTVVFDAFKEKARLVCSIDNPEFHLAVKRALITSDERCPVVLVIGNAGQITLTSVDPVNLASFEETIPVNGVDQFHFAINGDFLESVCGSWPLSVWFADNETAVMFESEDASFRFVVMPMKAEWKGVDLSAREIPADEPVSQPAVSMSTVMTKTIQRMNRTTKVKPAGNAWVSAVQF